MEINNQTCPGSGIRSNGQGRLQGYGQGSGPKGIPAGNKLTMISLGNITRLMRTIRGLQGKVFIVGGLVTEGSTLRDIDIVITNPKDIDQIKKALGKYQDRAHFILQKKEPPATLFVKITGKEGTTPDLYKGKGKIPKNEYAS